MRFVDLRNFEISNIDIKRDCEFESLYLIGKVRPLNKRVVSYISDLKYMDAILTEDLAGIIVAKGLDEVLMNKFAGGICVSEDPKTTFFQLHNLLAELQKQYFPSRISENAKIDASAIIAENNVIIEDNVFIGANVIIKENSHIKKNSIIRENTILGTPAFYYYGKDENRRLVTSTGGITIEENAELHTNCIVECGVMGENTIIGANTKIDNACVIGHDTSIGRNCTIAGNTLFAGGVQVGDNTYFGVSVTISPNVKIGKDVKISSGSVVTKTVNDGEHVSGNFAVNHQNFIKFIKKISE